MPIDITMPRLSDTMESGTILKWNVSEGDQVSAGDVVADIETDKATMEMQVYDDGTIAKIVVSEGESVNIGTTIAVLAEKGESVEDAGKSAGAASKRQKAASEEKERGEDESGKATATQDRASDEDQQAEQESEREGGAKTETAAGSDQQKKRDESPDQDGEAEKATQRREPEPAAEPGAEANGRIRVSPVARRLADDHDVDVRNIQGSGPGGRIIKRDVMNAIESGKETAASVPPAAKRRESAPVPATKVALAAQSEDMGFRPLEARSIQLSNMRQTIARRLVESKTTIPHYQVTVTFNMDPLLELRATLNRQLEVQGVKLSVNDFLVRACALAMHRHHEFNASWADDHIDVHGEVNIGVAIAVPRERGGGLVVATLRNADQRGLRQISSETKQLGEKARTRGLTIEEMSDSTFTISNLGMYGVEHFTAIINPPNSAILAVGAAVEKPVVRDGRIVVGTEMQVTLSCDHRVIDGAMAAEYLQTVRQLLENPASLLV